jgi:hypothetical protein
MIWGEFWRFAGVGWGDLIKIFGISAELQLGAAMFFQFTLHWNRNLFYVNMWLFSVIMPLDVRLRKKRLTGCR